MDEGSGVVPEGGHCEVSCMPNPPWESSQEPCSEHVGAVGVHRHRTARNLSSYLERESSSGSKLLMSTGFDILDEMTSGEVFKLGVDDFKFLACFFF